MRTTVLSSPFDTGLISLVVIVAAQWTFGSATAFAYCRTTTCGSEKSADCAELPKCPDGGVPLYWPDHEIKIGIENGSDIRNISPEAARDILTTSMAAWTSVDCGGGHHPSITVAPIQLTPVSGSPGDRDATSDAVNALRFFDSDWPHDPAAIALTTVRYGTESGRIVAADIEANSFDHNMTIVDVGGEFDLQSVLTHEAGHFFGLAHVIEPEPTMFASYSGGGATDRRSLETNDQEGMCAIYPPGRFDEHSRGCSCTVGRRGGRGPARLLAAMGA
jgi:hypothetical protein